MPASLIAIFREFLQVCLFRKRPQDLPAVPVLLWLAGLLYLFINTLVYYPVQDLPHALINSVVETFLLMGITWLFLYLRNVPKRWLQTCIALTGTGVIFSLIAFPLYYLRIFVPGLEPLQVIVTLCIICMVFWNLGVMSHILRHALSSSWVMAISGAVCYVAIISYTLQTLLPGMES